MYLEQREDSQLDTLCFVETVCLVCLGACGFKHHHRLGQV